MADEVRKEEEKPKYSEEELEKALEDYFLNGKIIRAYELSLKPKPIRIVFQTLSLRQLEEITKIYSEPDILNKPLYALQIPIIKAILLRAIVEFNGQPLTEEKLDEMPVVLIEEIRKKYMEFENFCREVFTQTQKKS
ncbi:MAG: hypothetical protein QXI58_00560 [Candidatus Micrarchaeia archaeon]